MTQEQIMGLVRHGLTAVGGAAVMLGWMDEGTVTQIVGAAMTLIGFAWSMYTKVA